MNQELAKSQVCILLISGIEIWVDEETGNNLQKILQEIKENKFIRFDERTINTSSISAVLLPKDIEDRKRRQNGEWTCNARQWHQKGESCMHENPALTFSREQFKKEHGYYPLR